MATKPSFSVVIPARNAAFGLGQCLASTAQGEDEASPLEVIVVDDGSTDATAEVAEARGAMVVRADGQGPAAARNTGARAASGDLLVFMDADCEAEKGCFRALLAPFADPTVAGTRGGYASTQRSPVARFTQLEMEEKQERLAASRQAALVDTACAAYRRELFLAQGGFDQRLPATSVEDAEFSFRLTSQGRRLVYAPGALVRHRHPEKLGNYLWRKLRFGYFRAQLYGRYPARIRGDGYTPRLMPLQIVLAGAMVICLFATPWQAAAVPVAGGTLMVFLATALPMARRAWRVDRPLTPLVPPLLLARSLAQGFGLLAGTMAQVPRVRGGVLAANAPARASTSQSGELRSGETLSEEGTSNSASVG